jgi:hypothetical protein
MCAVHNFIQEHDKSAVPHHLSSTTRVQLNGDAEYEGDVAFGAEDNDERRDQIAAKMWADYQVRCMEMGLDDDSDDITDMDSEDGSDVSNWGDDDDEDGDDR